MRDDLLRLTTVHAGLDTLLALLLLFHFPSRPAAPPSRSAAAPRFQFLAGFRVLAGSKDCWLVLAVYAFPQCLVQLWQSMMVVSLTGPKLGFGEGWVEKLGLSLSLVSGALLALYTDTINPDCAAVLGSILLASLLSRFRRRLKLCILLLLAGAAVLYSVLTAVLEGGLPHSPTLLYLLLLPATTLALASSPLAFELAVETCYPVSEGVIGGWLTGWFNLLGAIFFLVFLVPGVGTRWLNYVLPASVLIPFPAIFLAKELYNRDKIDRE